MFNAINTINTELSHLNVAGADRKAVLSAAVVAVVAYSVPLPTSPVSNIYDHYNSSVKGNVVNEVSKINEHIIVDIPDVMEGVWAVWKSRYCAVHEGLSAEAINEFVLGAMFNNCKVIGKGALDNRGAIAKVAKIIAGEL